MLHQSGDVAVEQALGQLTDHRVLALAFGPRGAVVGLAGLGPPGDGTPTLEPREHGGDGGLGEPSLGVQGFPDVLDRRFAPFPDDPQDGELQLGELMATWHRGLTLIYRRRFTTVVCRCQGSFARARSARSLRMTAPGGCGNRREGMRVRRRGRSVVSPFPFPGRTSLSS